MQKLTVFSIILSISVLLIIGDLIFHDYLSDQQDNVFQFDEPTVTLQGESVGTPIEEPLLSEYLEEDEPVEIVDVVEAGLGAELFEQVGFESPVFKEAIFSGLVFQFLSFSDQTDAYVYQSNVFEGEDFVGTVYEIKYPTQTASFQGYLDLRDRAYASELGDVNEVNNYGEASFYFNHDGKTRTVYLVLRSGTTLYAFEYSYTAHEAMKKVFDLL